MSKCAHFTTNLVEVYFRLLISYFTILLNKYFIRIKITKLIKLKSYLYRPRYPKKK